MPFCHIFDKTTCPMKSERISRVDLLEHFRSKRFKMGNSSLFWVDCEGVLHEMLSFFVCSEMEYLCIFADFTRIEYAH